MSMVYSLLQMGPTLVFKGLEFGGCGLYININSHVGDKAEKNWLERSAESMELVLEDNDCEEERMDNHKGNKVTSAQLRKLQEVNLIMKFLMLISQKKKTSCTKLPLCTTSQDIEFARLVILVMAINNNLQKW